MTSLLTRLDLRGVAGPLDGHLPPAPHPGQGPVEAVADILSQVRTGGDAALRSLTERFDKVTLDSIRVPNEDFAAAFGRIGADLRRALEAARDNIEAYHRTQLLPEPELSDRGLEVREIRVPVDRAGCYVPGGKAPLASTVLMTAVPAKVAGVGSVAVVTPPGADGVVDDAILAACGLAGVDDLYRVGGAQGVAALAYGTETVRPVDVIVGPGNVYVATAERMVATEGRVGVPSAFTGPSEVAVIADDSSPADFAAIDLVLQAEHGPDGFSYLVCWDEKVLEMVSEAVDRFTADSPRREAIESTLTKGGYAVLVDGPAEAVEVANVIAAEHLEIMVADPDPLVAGIRAAGAVFVGPLAPASIGDYVAGPNHVLPTARSARFGSALRVDDFCKHIHVVRVDQQAFDRLAPHVETLASTEGLVAHADSVRIRRLQES